jgi:hypothetical protein
MTTAMAWSEPLRLVVVLQEQARVMGPDGFSRDVMAATTQYPEPEKRITPDPRSLDVGATETEAASRASSLRSSLRDP